MKRSSKPIFSKKTYLDVKKVLDSGNLIHGKHAEIFEKKISKYLNVKYCSLVSSGTAALHLGLKALKIGKDDLIARTEVTKRITKYCQENDLQKKEDKRTIHPDKTLRDLLRLKKGDELTFFNLQKYMKIHYPNKEGVYATA